MQKYVRIWKCTVWSHIGNINAGIGFYYREMYCIISYRYYHGTPYLTNSVRWRQRVTQWSHINIVRVIILSWRVDQSRNRLDVRTVHPAPFAKFTRWLHCTELAEEGMIPNLIFLHVFNHISLFRQDDVNLFQHRNDLEQLPQYEYNSLVAKWFREKCLKDSYWCSSF